MLRNLGLILFICINLIGLAGCAAPIVSSFPPLLSPSSPSLSSSLLVNPSPWPSPLQGFSTPFLPLLPVDDKEAIDQSIVVVWGSDGNSATGVVVGDGSQVLTAWDFEVSTAKGFKIMAPGGKTYESTIQTFDSRNALLLLKMEGMKHRAASIGDVQTLKTGQEVNVRQWILPGEFSKVPMLARNVTGTYPKYISIYYPLETIQQNQVKSVTHGSIVTDLQGSILGVVGVDYMKLVAHPHPSPFVPSVPAIIPGAGVFSSDVVRQPWVNSPLQIILIRQGGSVITTDSPNYDAISIALREIESNLGIPLSKEELKGYPGLGPGIPDGTLLTVGYDWPVSLYSNGKYLADAKWVSIQWNRNNEAPNLLFYGNKILVVEGGFKIESDINLSQIWP